MGIFSFLKKEEKLFDKKGFLLVIAVFSDRVVLFLLQKKHIDKKDEIFIEDMILETQEEGFFSKEFDFEKLNLNCGKIKNQLWKKNIKTKNVLFAFCPEVAKSVFVSKKFRRKNREQKISKDEINRMTANIKYEYSKKGNDISLEKIEKVLIDGYLIQKPIGLHGKDITIGLLGVLFKGNLNRNFKNLASFLRLNFKGVLAMDSAFVKAENEVKKIGNGLFINIFENYSSVFLIRNGFIDAVENVDMGYGELVKKISKELSVGMEEAENIKNKFIFGDLDVSVLEEIRNISFSASEDLLKKIKQALIRLGSADLLPGDVFICFSSDVSLQFKQIFRKGNNWYSDLPFVQNVDVVFLGINDVLCIAKDEKKLFTDVKDLYIYGIINSINKLK